MDFLIINFAENFLSHIITYFYALDDFEDFKNKYISPKNGELKKMYMEEEGRLIEEHQELLNKVDFGKFVIMQQVDRFLIAFRQDLLKKFKEETQQWNL